MTKAVDANEFYEKLMDGDEVSKSITLELKTGEALEDVQMSVVPKQDLADALHRMPDELFEQAEENELEGEDIEEAAEEMGGASSAISGDLVEAFEDLCVESLSHEKLSNVQMRHIISELSLEALFEMGSEIINLSIEETGDIEDFREQS